MVSNPRSRLDLFPRQEEWQIIRDTAQDLVTTGFLTGIKTPAQAFHIILMGRELGVGPVTALGSINIINGKPSCSAELMQALIYRDHGDNALIWDESTNEVATLSYSRRTWAGRKVHSFSMTDAKRAGLGGQNWTKYPASMLRARCVSAVARMAFSDVISGLSLPEEVGTLEDAPAATGWEHGEMETATETGFAPGGSGTGAFGASVSDGAPAPAGESDSNQLSAHDRLIVRREGGLSQDGSWPDQGAPVQARRVEAVIPSPAQAGPQSGSTGPEEATVSQRASIIKIAAKLGIETPDLDTFDRESAKALIQSLSQQFNARHQVARSTAST